MPASFVELPDGLILIATGLNDVLVWDALDLQAHAAGVRAPEFAPTITVSDAGDITGEYACFYRWVDRWGNYSRPTPFSNVVNAVDVGTITYTFAPDPAPPFAARRQVLRNTAGQGNVYYVDIDTPNLSSPTMESTREDDDLSAQESQVIQDEDGVTRYDRFYIPFNTISIMAYYIGRVFGAGYETYGEGSVSLVNGDGDVVGTTMPGFGHYLIDPAFRGDAEYRTFTAPGSGLIYLVTTITSDTDFPNWSFTVGPTGLDPFMGWAGPTQAFSNYTIAPQPYLRNTVFFSGAGLPEAFHPGDAFTIPEDGDKITALYVLDSFLFIAKRRATYRFSAESDPLRDGVVWPSIGRGCVNQRTRVVVGDVAYIMDEQGIYAFDGRDATPLSAPIQDLFRGTNKHGYRINWKCSRFFHAVHCPADEAVRFFVTLQGAYLPRQALCYCYTLNRWWIEEYPAGIGASCLGLSGKNTGTWEDGSQQVYLGGRSSVVYALGGLPTDTVTAWQPGYGNVVSDASFCRISTTATVGSEVVGAPLTITSGRGVGQTRLIVAVGTGFVVVDRPFGAVPDAGDTFGIGVIPYRYLTHRLALTESESQDELSIRLSFDPQAYGSVGIRRYVDHAKTPEKLAGDHSPRDADGLSGEKDDIEIRLDMTQASGYAVVRADRHGERDTPQARSVRVELVGASGPSRHTFSQIRVNGVQGP